MSDISPGSGGAMDPNATVKSIVNQVNYQCAPITVKTISGSMCSWIDGDVVGIVYNITDPDLKKSLQLTTSTHDAAERPA